MKVRQKLKVTGATIARMCKVTQQSIYGAKKTGLLIKEDNYFSLENPTNIQYLEAHGGNIKKYIQTIEKEENEKNRPPVDHRDPIYSDNGDQEAETKDELQKKLIMERTKDFQLKNEAKLGNLMSRKLVNRMFGEIKGEIKISLVDLPRRYATEIAAVYQMPSREREGELFISKILKTGIENIIEKICNISEGEHF